MIDWSNERWVKVYTRDTADWLLLSWQAQGLFVLLLRKVDRAGRLDLGRAGPRGIAAHLGGAGSWSNIEPCLAELVGDGCVVIEGASLTVPNFVTAQDARQSDAARKRTEREKRATTVDVTKRDTRSQNVTVSHVESHGVTTCHDQSRVEQNRTPQNRTGEGSAEGASPPVAVQPPPPSDAKVKTSTRVKTPKPGPQSDGVPTDGKALDVYRAIITDPVLCPITGNPGDFATRVTADGAHPGVDVLSEVRRAGEYASRYPSRYSDGRRFLSGWLQRAAGDAAKAPKPGTLAAGAPHPKSNGIHPGAPASAFAAATALGSGIARDPLLHLTGARK